MKITITDVKVVKHENVKANFTVVLDDAVELFGFRLMYSNKKDVYYIAPPANKYKDKYYDLVRFSVPVRNKILSDAIDCYHLENKNNITIIE